LPSCEIFPVAKIEIFSDAFRILSVSQYSMSPSLSPQGKFLFSVKDATTNSQTTMKHQIGKHPASRLVFVFWGLDVAI
jgi:hypothetical protein